MLFSPPKKNGNAQEALIPKTHRKTSATAPTPTPTPTAMQRKPQETQPRAPKAVSRAFLWVFRHIGGKTPKSRAVNASSRLSQKDKKAAIFFCPIPLALCRLACPHSAFGLPQCVQPALFPPALSPPSPPRKKKRRRGAPKMQDPGFGRSAKMKQGEGKNHSFDLSCRSASKRRAQAGGRTS